MDYTDEQYAIIERLEAGLNYWNLSEDQQWFLRYLQDEGIAQPRADIADGHYLLTEFGKRILFARVERQLKESQESAKIASDEAKQEKQQCFENKIAIANLLIPLITYILGIFTEHYAGIFVEHFAGISDLIMNLIKKFFA